MADYVTTEEVGGFAHEFAALSSTSADILVTSASRLFDNLCEVEEDFFAEEDGTTDTRYFVGDGTAFLKLPPYVDLDTVELNDGTIETPDYSDENVPDYIDQNGTLVALDKTKYLASETASYPYRFEGWPDGKQIKVDAIWGWVVTPSDVKLAVIHLAIHLWRTADPAFAVVSNAESAAGRTITVPQVAQTIIDKYREKYSRRVIFA